MRHKAQIAHHAKGRLRVRVPTAKGNPQALEEIRKSFASLTGVESVSVNAAIGTVTVIYDPDKHEDFHEHLTGEGHHQKVVDVPAPPKFSEVDEVAEVLEKEAEYLSSRSHTAKALIDALKGFDRGLKKATGNQVDLKVLTPLGLAVYAFLELGFEAATPVWLTLGIFSFNHFVELHTHHDAVASQNPQPPATQTGPSVRSR
jgi:hypothetical protein